MTRAALSILTVLVLGLVAVFAFALSVSNRMDDLLPARADSGGAPVADSRGVEGLKAEVSRLAQDVASLKIDRAQLRAEISRLRDASGGDLARLAEGEELTATAPAPVVPDASHSALESAVAKVIEEREAAERQERLERMARGGAGRLLGDIVATDEQTDQFVSALSTYYRQLQDVMQKARDEEIDEQGREVETDRIARERNDKLLRIFGPADFERIRERLERGRGRFAAPGGAGFRGQGGQGQGRPGR